MGKKKQKPKPQKKKKPKGKAKAKPKAKARHGMAPAARKEAADTKGPVKAIQGLPQFERQVLEGEKPAIVDFWAEWCGPCKAMAPLFAEFAEEHGDDIFFAKVDTERSADIAEAFNIRSLPTFLAFHEGVVIDQKVGVVMPVAMEKWIEKLKKKTGIVEEAPAPAPAPTPAEAPAESLSFGQRLRRFFGGK